MITYNFADDNIIAVTCNNLVSLCQILEEESELAIDWYKNNSMIANTDKFQAIILSKDASGKMHKLRIYNSKMETTKSDYQIIKLSSLIRYLCFVLKWQYNLTLSIDCKGARVKLKKCYNK